LDIRTTASGARLFDIRFGRGHGRLARFERLHLVVVLLAADDVFLEQIDSTLGVGFVADERGCGFVQIALRLVIRRFERPRIDLEKPVALFHRRAVDVILRDEIAGDLGADFRIDQTGGEADPFADNRNILLDRRHDRHNELGRLRFRPWRTGCRAKQHAKQK
jgi:hypothetical protein